MADGVEKLGSEMVGKSCGHVGFISFFSRESDGKFGKIYSYGFRGFGFCIRDIRRSLIGSQRLLRHLKMSNHTVVNSYKNLFYIN